MSSVAVALICMVGIFVGTFLLIAVREVRSAFAELGRDLKALWKGEDQ